MELVVDLGVFVDDSEEVEVDSEGRVDDFERAVDNYWGSPDFVCSC